MKLNLNKPCLQLNGKPLEDTELTLGQMFANMLVSGAKGDLLKFYGWGIKLTANETLTLDKADLKVMKEFVESNENTSILLRAQILEAILEVENPKKEEQVVEQPTASA